MDPESRSSDDQRAWPLTPTRWEKFADHLPLITAAAIIVLAGGFWLWSYLTQ